MGRVRGGLSTFVALGIAAAVVVLLGFSDTLNPVDAVLGRGAMVEVPDLVGRPRPGAEADLTDLGLTPAVRTAFSLSVPRGTVIGQDPPEGTRLREGSKIQLVVSRGVNRVAMPDAVGRPLVEVVSPLEDAGVEVAVERRTSETLAEGLVITQEPGAGVQLTGKDRAELVVSAGPAPREVPDVAGRALPGAAYLLGAAGLVVTEVREVPDATTPVGAVVGTTPAAGTVVPRDTVVTVRISAGPAPVAVPPVVGSTGPAAREALDSAGFVPNLVSEDGVGVDGPVVSQEPAAGTLLRPGSVVTVVARRASGG